MEDKNQFTIGCYSSTIAIYSIPIIAETPELLDQLERGEFPINGEPLSEAEFKKLAGKVPTGVEIGWSPELSYYLEGSSE